MQVHYKDNSALNRVSVASAASKTWLSLSKNLPPYSVNNCIYNWTTVSAASELKPPSLCSHSHSGNCQSVTQHKALVSPSSCLMQSFLGSHYISALAVMQWDLSKVWNQSSLILRKVPDQTEGPIWKTVANTKEQTFHRCIFLEEQHSSDRINSKFQGSWARYLQGEGCQRRPSTVRFPSIKINKYHKSEILPSKVWCSCSNWLKTCISCPFFHFI